MFFSLATFAIVSIFSKSCLLNSALATFSIPTVLKYCFKIDSLFVQNRLTDEFLQTVDTFHVVISQVAVPDDFF